MAAYLITGSSTFCSSFALSFSLVSGGLLGGSIGGGGSRSVGGFSGSNIGLGLTFVGNISNITSVSVYGVGHLLYTAIGHKNIVRATGGVSISLLFLTVVVRGVVVLDGPAVGIGGRGGWFFTVGGGGGSVGTGKSGTNGKEAAGC